MYSKWWNDECYTPKYWVIPLLKHLESYKIRNNKKNLTIWCPFDKEESEFVKVFVDNGYNVIFSHIENGQDFYNWQPNEEYDLIISNPPFSWKRKIFERTLSLQKPFALLMTLTWLNDSWSKLIYINSWKQMQLLMFDKRIKYIQPWKNDNNKITFSSWYYCCDFLEKDIMLEKLEVNINHT